MLLPGGARFTPGFRWLWSPGCARSCLPGLEQHCRCRRTRPVLSQPERHDPTGDDNLASAGSPGLQGAGDTNSVQDSFLVLIAIRKPEQKESPRGPSTLNCFEINQRAFTVQAYLCQFIINHAAAGDLCSKGLSFLEGLFRQHSPPGF